MFATSSCPPLCSSRSPGSGNSVRRKRHQITGPVVEVSSDVIIVMKGERSLGDRPRFLDEDDPRRQERGQGHHRDRITTTRIESKEPGKSTDAKKTKKAA